MNDWDEIKQIVASNAKAIEALGDKLVSEKEAAAQRREDSAQEIDKIKQLINSNAKAIQALANESAEERKERQRNERRLFDAMAKMSDAIAMIGSAQASLWEIQADYYRRLEEMDERQAKMIEILDRLSN